MATKHIETRKKLRSFVLKEDFYAFIDKVILSAPERILLERFYIDNCQMMEIADEIGLSEYAVLKMHDRVLKKLEEVL